MENITFMENYNIYTKDLLKENTTFQTIDQIMEYFKQKVEENKNGKFISIFDHYQHTKELEDGEIAEGIIDAKNFIFCFGVMIPNPNILAVRPRSIGVVEYKDKFVVNFMQAPKPTANKAMMNWVNSLENK